MDLSIMVYKRPDGEMVPVCAEGFRRVGPCLSLPAQF